MKLIHALLFLAITTFSVLSCSKSSKDDDDNNPGGGGGGNNNTSSIVGKWEAVSDKDDHYENGTLVDTEETTYDTDEMVWEFKSDKTITASANGEVMGTGTWATTGNKLVVTDPEEGPMEFTYTVNSTTLTIVDTEIDGQDKYVYTITFKKK